MFLVTKSKVNSLVTRVLDDEQRNIINDVASFMDREEAIKWIILQLKTERTQNNRRTITVWFDETAIARLLRERGYVSPVFSYYRYHIIEIHE